MITIHVASTRRYSGKTGVCVALIDELTRRGHNVGYIKPYGGMPVTIDGLLTDQDAVFVNGTLSVPGPADSVCPIVRSRAFVEQVLSGTDVEAQAKVEAAFERAGQGRDIMVVEAPSDLEQGAAARVSMPELLGLLGGKVLLVEACSGFEPPDRILRARSILGPPLAGVIHNRVSEADRHTCVDRIVSFLDERGVRSFGLLSQDPLLSSVMVREIVDGLGGAVLVGEDALDTPVESFMVGAMGQEKALRFFRRKANKAVVTGGDRADVQMAALETSTAALILTGNLPPSPAVLGRADELGVPVVMVDSDTLGAVEHMDTLFGHVRLHGPGKADRMRRMFTDGIDVPVLLEALGVEPTAKV